MNIVANKSGYRSDSGPNQLFSRFEIFWLPMLEIHLIGDPHAILDPPRHRESTSFTPLELETKSYQKILKNKKVRAKSLRGIIWRQITPPFARQCFGPLSY